MNDSAHVHGRKDPEKQCVQVDSKYLGMHVLGLSPCARTSMPFNASIHVHNPPVIIY